VVKKPQSIPEVAGSKPLAHGGLALGVFFARGGLAADVASRGAARVFFARGGLAADVALRGAAS
jgi:hypothetical protein